MKGGTHVLVVVLMKEKTFSCAFVWFFSRCFVCLFCFVLLILVRALSLDQDPVQSQFIFNSWAHFHLSSFLFSKITVPLPTYSKPCWRGRFSLPETCWKVPGGFPGDSRSPHPNFRKQEETRAIIWPPLRFHWCAFGFGHLFPSHK